ncbi:cubilin-like [Daphnia carinata]|uniref:cubilin-like n=1 Tax=Daphnia carinata TaxID=120202 RepID=UPI00286868CD|nr:cubilin-like [Daphnia carinata]XP_059351719.1 cubilin-like [Daphnia carinata]
MMEFAIERATLPRRCHIWTAFAALVLPLLVGVRGAIIHPGCECVEYSSTFGQPFGQFTSPDFPKPYDPGIGCVLYTFTAPVASASGPAISWIVELTITNLNLPPTSTCGDGDHLALYLHLDQGEINEKTPSNGRLCSLPAKRSGRYGSQAVRYYSAKSSLVVAFHTIKYAPTANHPSSNHRVDSSSFSTPSNSTHGPYGFKGTYRFIRKSKFRSGGQRIGGTVCDYQFISGGAVSRQDQQPSSNKFYSPLYPSLYPARSRCLYHFYGRHQERVKIHFEKLILGEEDVSCLWSEDGVKVYDGGDVQSPVIAHLCGVIHHAELWSSSSSLLVEFYSSNSSEHTFEGFEGRYSFLPAARGADEYDDMIEEDDDEEEEEEDNEDGFLINPPGVTSSTTWSTPTTSAATTTTTRRRTSMTTPSTARTITFSRPMNVTTPSIRRVQVASTKPTSTSTSRTTTRTTSTTSTTTQSTVKQTTLAPRTSKLPLIIAATTTATSEISDAQSNLGLDTNTSSPCDRLFRSDVEKNGTFTSPGYPAAYGPFMNCNYEFRGHGRERVQIIFTDFVLHHPHDDPSEKPHHPWLKQSCDGADRVTAFISVGGNKEKIDDFCGSGTPRELMSNSAVMSLHFHSTAVSRGARGFKARYAFVSNFGITTGEQISTSPCAFRFNSTTSTNGTFWSPNFPGFYPRDTECHYFFHAQVGERVKIVFSYFDIEGMIPCGLTSASDFVEVSNFMTVDRKLPRYCGLQKDLKMESDGAFFRVTFKSNDRFDGTGFHASYQFTPVADAVTITRRRSSSPASSSPYPVGCILLFYLLAYLIS